jgi:DNA polymerase-3 subunit beta
MFRIGDFTIVCRLIDEKFPDYQSAIPVDLPNKLLVNRLDLINSLRRLQIFANKNHFPD